MHTVEFYARTSRYRFTLKLQKGKKCFYDECSLVLLHRALQLRGAGSTVLQLETRLAFRTWEHLKTARYCTVFHRSHGKFLFFLSSVGCTF